MRSGQPVVETRELTKKYGRFEDNARQGDHNGTAAVPRPATPAGDGRLAMRTPDLGKILLRS